ncbi:hypothetical protein AB9P05_00300 [Roseivirga sp. BDSF3-8]|uniref:hypothetical protein n=1 Tax=Roseivirga sp. BDSF3-8 TaxID=3241598 RepID=UPI0035323B83
MIWALVFFCLFSSYTSYGQAVDERAVRRWYVVLHDFSSPFEYRSPSANTRLYRTLYRLFENEVTVNRSANTLLLEDEQLREIPFFDSEKDNISLFYFGIRMQDLRKVRQPYSATDMEQYEAFAGQFLHQVTPDWVTFHQNNPEGTFEDMFQRFKNKRPAWRDGYSLSSYAYPAVITALEDHYFDELIIIVLSDYLAGSTFGNKQDGEIVRQGVFGGNSTLASKVNTAHDQLNARFYKIDYFDYAVNTGKYDNARNRIFHGIKAYKVKPHAGLTAANNAVMKIDSDLSLDQDGYRSTDFETSPITINFEHNRRLQVEKIGVQVEIGGEVLHSRLLARSSEDEEGALVDHDDDPIEVDSVSGNYFLPSTYLSLGGINTRAGLEEALPLLTYVFYTRYRTEAGNIPLMYQVSRPLNNQNVDFDKNYSILMTTVLPTLIFLGLALWLLYKRRPGNIRYQMSAFGDSYEKIDYRSIGRLKTPYRAFTGDTARIPFRIFFTYDLRYLRGSVPLNLRLDRVEAPRGFDMHLLIQEEEDQYQSVFRGDTWRTLPIRPDVNKPFEFFVVIKKTDPQATLDQPMQCAFQLSIWADHRFVWRTDLSATISEAFHIGPAMGDAWIGLDPGTTGTCIAAGTHFSNVAVRQDTEGRDLIESSLIVFDPSESPDVTDWRSLGGAVVKVGREADPFETILARDSFRSVKKLLGFTDKKTISFENGDELRLDGTQITYLMVKKLLAGFRKTVEAQPDTYSYLLQDGLLNASRVALAIPNNFTATKTQAFVDSVGYLNAYSEVRVIPEAEAVMVYYIFNRLRLTRRAETFDQEKVLIFDMGGATINASLIDGYAYEEQGDRKYHLTVEGKLGYGIGGDTIDYCILNILYEWVRRYRELPSETIDFDTVSKESLIGLLKLAQRLKIQLIRIHNQNRPYFVSQEVSDFLEEFYHLYTGQRADILVDSDDEVMDFFNKEFYNHPLLDQLIYKNVKASVIDILQVEGYDNEPLTVLYSGRSTLFPYIKTKVASVLKSKGISYQEVFLREDELKSAVARGACLYGVSNNAITIDSSRIHSHFGIVHSRNAGVQGFKNLVPMGSEFNGESGIRNVEELQSSFDLDGKQVRFVQVMGQNADEIINNNEKHKYSPIAKVRVHTRTKRIGMVIAENDQVRCRVEETDGELHDALALISDQEIADTNEKHYTWLLG